MHHGSRFDRFFEALDLDGQANRRHAASHVDRIFKGANPAELPVEQVDWVYFIIKMNTACNRPRSSASAGRPRRRDDRVRKAKVPVQVPYCWVYVSLFVARL